MDAAVVPQVRSQRRPPPAACARLQSRQLPAHPGAARRREALVADDTEGQAREDRRKGRSPRALRHLPDGRGRHPERPVCRHLAPHRPAQAEVGPNMTVGIGLIPAPDRTGAPKLPEFVRFAACMSAKAIAVRLYGRCDRALRQIGCIVGGEESRFSLKSRSTWEIPVYSAYTLTRRGARR